METLRNQIIDQIFKLLAPLRSLYKEEIDKVTNDLLNNDTKSLEEFINKYYNDVSNTKEFAELIQNLVNSNLIDSSFLEQIIIPKEAIKQVSIRPLNVRIETLNNIKKNSNLSKLEPTKFPVSLMEKKETIENDKATNTEKVELVTNEVTPVEIEPDYNTTPDIQITFDSDKETEIPDFNTYQNKETAVDLPNTNVNVELPVIETPSQPVLEIQTPNIISKDEIFESIQSDNNNPINEQAEEPSVAETANDNLKNTTQFGQILQFPYGSYIPNQVEQTAIPASNNYVSIEPTMPHEDTNLPNTDMLNQTATTDVMPSFEANQVKQTAIPVPDNYVSIEPTMAHEDTNLPNTDMLNQTSTTDVMPSFETNQVEQTAMPVPDNYVSIEPTMAHEDTNLPNTDMMNQTATPDVMPYFETNQIEEKLPSMPLPDDMIKKETPPTPQKTEEELKQEIENKVREAVREELKQEISELTNKTKEELKQEISEMATKTKEEVKQELTEKIREEEKNNILRIQNDYMNNATEFIRSLDDKDEEEIYTSLRLLNDLRYMSHCIAHLSPKTLERFYLYIERKLNSPEKEFMDTIIEKRIKEILPPNISYNLELEATNSNEVFRKTA